MRGLRWDRRAGRSYDTVAPDVFGLHLRLVNVFAIAYPDGWVLVDTGTRGSAGLILAWARRRFGSRPPDAIVLTHGHFDHVGALPELLERWRAPVFAHAEEIPYLTGERMYPPADPSVGGGLLAWMSWMFPRRSADIGKAVRPLSEFGAMPHLAGWHCIHTPGHSAGHVSFFRPADRTVIVGDAFCTTKQESLLAVLSQRPELHGPPAYFTTDWAEARRSIETLAALEPDIVAPAHGRPLTLRAAGVSLRDLVSHFDEAARPARGRYLAHPVHG